MHFDSSDPTGGQATQIADAFMTSLAKWAINDSLWGLTNLMHSFGQSTEPDFVALVPTYDRVLAISLLVMGAIIALAITERVVGGGLGIGLDVVPRVLLSVFCAYSGLAIVQYVSGYAGLLGHAWDKELSAADASHAVPASGLDVSHIHINFIALIFMALLLSFLALIVYLELIVRSALILTITAFVPLVCVLAIWPRMQGAATHLAEFVLGLLLSKFVVATAFFVGLSLLFPAVLGVAPHDGNADWMASGFAVLLITAFSPLALFQGIRFAHSTAGTVARGWTGMAASMLPVGLLAGGASGFIAPAVGVARKGITSGVKKGIQSMRRSRGGAQ